jgi:hypothetical protein
MNVMNVRKMALGASSPAKPDLFQNDLEDKLEVDSNIQSRKKMCILPIVDDYSSDFY